MTHHNFNSSNNSLSTPHITPTIQLTTSFFLLMTTHHSYHSETQMLRYMKHLENKGTTIYTLD